MSFTPNQNLENQPSGQADWDSGLNGNFTILDRGFHGILTAAMDINTGDILWVGSGALAYPLNANSLSLKDSAAISYKQVNSGESDNFLFRGIISSVGIWSGNIVPGQDIFISQTTPGFAVSSYAGANPAVGLALRDEQLYFSPGQFTRFPEQKTVVISLGPLAQGSTHFFTTNWGRDGQVQRIDFRSESHDLWTLKFFSGSAQVDSERLYETASGGVSSIFMRDQAPWYFENTDTASLGEIFGVLDVQSNGTGVGSGYFNMTVLLERFD